MVANSNYVVDRGRKWDVTAKTAHGIEFHYGKADDVLDITKTFDIVPDAYMVHARIAVKVKADAIERLVVSVFALQDPKKAAGGSSRIAARAWESARMKFSDLSAGHLAYPAASIAVAAGVMTLGPEASFQPTRPISGEEAAAAIGRIESLAGPLASGKTKPAR